MKLNSHKIRQCKICNKDFKLNVYKLGEKWLKENNRGIFCSRKCYHEFRKGMRISIETEFKKGNIGEKNPNWKGGIEITKQGYVKIMARNHPFSHRDKVFEHRLVMEKHLGRFLKREEVVHHIDSNRSNNSLDNLMLFKNQSLHMKYEGQK